MSLTQTLWIGIGGFLGTLGRYIVSTMVYRYLGVSFPYGTLTVNLIGCFLFGLVSGLFEERHLLTPATRLFLTVGVLGGFTTFSSFGDETLVLLKSGKPAVACLYVGASVLVGVVAVWIGSVVAKAV